jgi:hypothetical protein
VFINGGWKKINEKENRTGGGRRRVVLYNQQTLKKYNKKFIIKQSVINFVNCNIQHKYFFNLYLN